MDNYNPDISKALISNEFIIKKLPAILVDSILVDNDFNLVLVSQNILDILEYTGEELASRTLNCLASSNDLVMTLKQLLDKAYFDEKAITLYSKSGIACNFIVSGFYLGLISDINGLIVLTTKEVGQVKKLEEKLLKKAVEIDRFIYRTAHDLRGPLATIKGLINLIKIREGDEELDRFLLLLEAHANRLDERLFQLAYVTQSANINNAQGKEVDFNAVETGLRQVIEKNAFVDFLEFNYSAPGQKISQVDGPLLLTLLTNVLLFILSLPMTSAGVKVTLNILAENGFLRIAVLTHGFEIIGPLREVINESDSIYSHMIDYPQLMNYYAAQKVALQMKGIIDVQFHDTDRQLIGIFIPFHTL